MSGAGPVRERRLRLFVALGLAVAVLAGGGLWYSLARSGDDQYSTARPGQRPRTDGPETGPEGEGQPVALTPGRGLLLGSPIYNGDFADPFVLTVGDTLYAYATNTDDANVPVIVIRSATEGTYAGDVLPQLRAAHLDLVGGAQPGGSVHHRRPPSVVDSGRRLGG